ncbi:MAG TPA: GNAT family N-acetyltransferase [Chthonomonadaceae bacterium]|nr:GNAT family N-acetyltransferase [Chthonomonadaceae bacterium]
MSVQVRRAEREDFEAFVGLVRALADYERLERPTPAAERRLQEDGWPESGEPRFQAWIAEATGDDGGPSAALGYAITFFSYSSFLARPTLYLEDLFILPDRRRAGAGSALFARLREFAAESGCGRIEWVVLDWNELAQQFYRKIGAQHMREWHTYRLTLESG